MDIIARENEKYLKNKLGRKHRRDTKLQELERQLEFAESRCGTLKQQLDYLKKFYGCMRDTNLEEKQLSREEGHGDGSNIKQFTYHEFSKWDNSGLLNGEDGDGPNLTKQAISYSNTTSTNSSNKNLNLEKYEHRKKSPKAKTHLKLLKVKKKSCKKVKKKRKHDDGGSSKVSNASSQTQSQIFQDPVVEIYKNSAVNVESESGLEVFGKNNLNKPNDVLSEILRGKIGGKTNSRQQDQSKNDSQTKSCNSLDAKKAPNCLKVEEVQTDISLDLNNMINQNKQIDVMAFMNKENTSKAESVITEPVKSYCQPTISSKRKQVDRDIYSNLNFLNIRNIPFVAAKSTAPSHNIGVNIQQVLSVLKKRHPMGESFMNVNYNRSQENSLLALLSSRKLQAKTKYTEMASPSNTGITSSSELRKRGEAPRTSLSHWKSNSEITKEKPTATNLKNEDENADWSFKVEKLKKVLVSLHEDFTSLSQKYKRLQKKLTKRNITKTDAKDELANIERDLEKKEEEITVVIALYKEVLQLKEELKDLQEKYSLATCARSYVMEGIKQSSSAHIQMTSLLRKIQNFQDQLKELPYSYNSDVRRKLENRWNRSVELEED